MPLRLSTAQDQDAAQNFLREKFKGPQEAVGGQNVSALLNLETTSTLVFRGREYLVPPIGYKDGIELQRLYFKLQNLGVLDEEFAAKVESEYASRLRELEQLLTEMAWLFKRLVTPKSLLSRVTWRFSSNPFLDGSQQEIGEMLGFFSACRMKSTVAFADKHPAPSPKDSTPSMN